MTRAALIILDDDLPTTRIAGLGWAEFQLRQATRAGASHIVVVAGRVVREIVVAMDRLRAEGLSLTLVRTAAEAADLFHPDEAVLLLSGAVIVAPARLDDLYAAPTTALLCVEGTEANARYELIDAKDRWTGIARLQGAQVRAVAEGVGEWDFASMLLRAAVRGQAERIAVGEGDRLIDATDPAAARHAARSIVAGVSVATGGWGSRWVVNPVARLLARLGIDILPTVARFGPWLVVPMLALAPWAAFSWGIAAGSAVLLLAMLARALGIIAAGSTGESPALERAISMLTVIAAVLVLVIGVWPRSADLTQPVLAAVLAGLCVLAARLPLSAKMPFWLADLPGYTIVLLVAALFGPWGLIAGLGLAVVHGFVSLAWLQNRLSPPLTP